MDISFSVDERVAEQARAAAQAMGKSLDQVVREYLERLAGDEGRAKLAEAFVRSALETPGRLNGWKFNRDEINERSKD